MRRLVFLILAACSSTPSDTDGGTDASNINDGTTNDVFVADTGVKDAGSDVSVTDSSIDSSVTDASDAGTQYTLTINDYIDWCGVSVNMGTTMSTTPQTFMFPSGALVNLHADTVNASMYNWGYWTGVAADGGNDTSMTTSITMTSNKTIEACCPLKNATTCP